MSSNIQQLAPDRFFHVFNRAVGNEKLFLHDEDYHRWLGLIKMHLLPLSDIFAYCLLPNHYHLLIRLNDDLPASGFSKAMSDAANTYSKLFNAANNRKGSLFMRPFKRKALGNEHLISWTFWYIHRNPMHHGYTKDWPGWKYSSYPAYCSDSPSLLNRKFFIDFYGSLEALKSHHTLQVNETIAKLISIE
jgi:putative transposase